MKRRFFLIVLAVLMLTAVLPAAYAPQTVLDADIAARADAYMSALLKAQRFNGTVLLAREGRVIFKKGYGMANFEWDLPNVPSTKFRLGSITKQFTSMAIMQLEERGLLKADNPIGKYLTDYPKPVADQVTIHHLLTHTSGIPSYTDSPDYPKQMMMPLGVKEMIDRFKDKPLEFEPGAKFKYDNSGYFLLGAIVEKVSGKSYETFLKENIFQPLGMNNSGYDHSSTLLKNRAAGYNVGPNGVENSAYLDMGQPYAAGSLYSTVEDLLLWDQALYTEKLVKQPALEHIFKPWIAAGNMGSYGYGWAISTVKGHKNIAHGGGINGFSTYISRFPEDHAVFIWLRNVLASGSPTINQDLAGILFGEKIEPPKEKIAVAVDTQVFEALLGSYELAPQFVLTVTREGDRVFAQATGQGKNEIFPLSATRYFLRIVEAEIEFFKNDKGEVDRLVLHQGGRDTPGKKVKEP